LGLLSETAAGSGVMEVVSEVGNVVVVVVQPSVRKHDTRLGRGCMGPKMETECNGSVLGVMREIAAVGDAGR
jgi:hypothetical protein